MVWESYLVILTLSYHFLKGFKSVDIILKIDVFLSRFRETQMPKMDLEQDLIVFRTLTNSLYNINKSKNKIFKNIYMAEQSDNIQICKLLNSDNIKICNLQNTS